jgi:ribosomal protein S18 acetylase RimI-like enzyme
MTREDRIRVRPASLPDIEVLSDIWRELMDYHQMSDERFALAEDATSRWCSLAEDMLNRQDGFLLVADRNDTAIGFCLGWIARNPPIYRVPEVGFVSEIAVRRVYQRQGVGRALIAAAIRFFEGRGVDEFQLSTAVWNEDAHAFWKALGGEVLLLRYRFSIGTTARHR